MTSTKIQRNWK